MSADRTPGGSGEPSPAGRTPGGSGEPTPAGRTQGGGSPEGSPTLDPLLLEVLACPAEDHAPLTFDDQAQTLTCTSCGRVFPVRDGLPVLLLDEVIQ